MPRCDVDDSVGPDQEWIGMGSHRHLLLLVLAAAHNSLLWGETRKGTSSSAAASQAFV